ncbi:MAG TPA: DUF1735 domain-containing protein [Bacteroidales bacterium]|nr:DUF1735 domain-containing protein [Bacteroidales bacterium]
MKKILGLIILSMIMTSCYEDYIKDFTYTGVYFPYQQDVRSFIVGEGMKIRVGAAFGGVRKNDRDRIVNFELRNSLLTPAQLEKMQGATQTYINESTVPVAALLPLPSNYYTMSNSGSFTIKAGQHMGDIEIKADSVAFLSDPATIYATYALPFYITSADVDSVVSAKRYNVIGLKYEHLLFGNYWHGGQAVVNRPGLADTTMNYFTEIPTPEVKIWSLKTFSPNSVVCNAFMDQAKPNGTEMVLQLNGDQVTIATTPGATWTITPDGASTFNNPKLLQNRKLFLKYKFTNTTTGYTYHCTDTITFRNRIRDGINEWQDENPSHYLK